MIEWQKVYPVVTQRRGVVIDYLGMTFDFSVTGQVAVTMKHTVDEIISDSKIAKMYATPAADNLFEVREGVPVADEASAKFFRSFVAKILYVAKRVKPECLTAVSFLSTRVNCCDTDDLTKLDRLLGYVLASRDRGIVLRVGGSVEVKGYIDASYGVHRDARSHTGAVIVIGDAGPIWSKSAIKKSNTKSSAEAELMALSDTAGQVIHIRNFIMAQGYDVAPAILYQDNLSCMALVKKGRPTSERSRHIAIREFWVTDRVERQEVEIKHLGTKLMFANLLTKPVQGGQFLDERRLLTNWSM